METVIEKIKSVFETLNGTDLSKKSKEKSGLTYIPWASAWEEVKKHYPDATYEVVPQIMDEYGNERFWHDDGKTGWVEVRVTINGHSLTEHLAIMDFKNKSMSVEQITSVDANKAMKRCLVKAIALHGLGLYVFRGEDLPEEAAQIIELRREITDLINKKVKLSDAAKDKVAEVCKKAEKDANPDMADDLIRGDPKNINDVDILTELKQRLQAIRK